MTSQKRLLLLGLGVFFLLLGGLLAYRHFETREMALSNMALQAKKKGKDIRGEVPKVTQLVEHSLGSKTAPVTIVEYASATCPHCARFQGDVFPNLKKEFIDTGKVRFVFREFPLDPVATAAFMVVRCSSEEAYFPMLETLFARQKEWIGDNVREELFKIAKATAGLSREKFESCLKDEPLARGIYAMRQKGEKEDKVHSTPSFVVNGKLLEGETSLEEFRKEITLILEKNKS